MSKSRSESELLAPCDAARLLGITTEGVRFLAVKGRLPEIRLRNGRRVFRAVDVERLARERQKKRQHNAA